MSQAALGPPRNKEREKKKKKDCGCVSFKFVSSEPPRKGVRTRELRREKRGYDRGREESSVIFDLELI